MKSVQIYPQVFAADVLAEIDDVERDALADIAIEMTAGAFAYDEAEDTEPGLGTALALAGPGLRPGPIEQWLVPYGVGDAAGRRVELVKRVRARNHAGFALVHELDGYDLDNDWQLAAGLARQTDPQSAAGFVLPPVYTLGLCVVPPPAAVTATFDTCKEAFPKPVLPYGASPAVDREVMALAVHLAPRMQETIGGARRLEEQPVLAPICAAVATVWIAMQQRPMRNRARKPRYRSGGLAACIAGLDLAEHECTFTRIILRDHRRHIPVDVSRAPTRFVLPEWNGRLGVFVSDGDGRLGGVDPDQIYRPPVLFSVAEPEPL
ncbi:MAG: hypothetical protein IT348_11170 [Candidatus Eisenbacteria bacterium]|nr:hypothetical protein [Candidatus Eisenbacteria bacterium]